MNTRMLWCMLACACVSTVGFSAEPAKKTAAKSEAETAYSEFGKVLNNRAAKQDQAQFEQAISSGLKFLVKYPTAPRAVDVVRDLGTYPLTYLRDKSSSAQRGVFMSLIRYHLISASTEANVTDEAKVALAALDAAIADSETRLQPNRQNLQQLREKIDQAAALPNSGRFVAAREQSYAEILGFVSSKEKAEAHLRTLVDSPDKSIKEMAQRELTLLELRKAPLELKFTTLDGKPFDLSQLRGKVVAVYFWSTTNPASTKAMDTVQEVYSFNRKAGFEVVTVSYDKLEDREKLVSFVKQNRIGWPVHFDGSGTKHELGSKLGVTSVPRLVLCDRQGMIVSTNLPLHMLEPTVKQLTKAN